MHRDVLKVSSRRVKKLFKFEGAARERKHRGLTPPARLWLEFPAFAVGFGDEFGGEAGVGDGLGGGVVGEFLAGAEGDGAEEDGFGESS